jgi:SAM-dependent methyltransferase
MQHALLRWVSCPGCFQPLTLGETKAEEGGEILQGSLSCVSCRAVYSILDGVPQLLPPSLDTTTVRTAESFGNLWSRTREETTREGLHLGQTLATLSLEHPSGLILDAGCGDGSDSVGLAARHGATVIGVDISAGGTRTAFERTRHLPNVHIVRADLCRLPFAAGVFDFVYSYGVVHHVPRPEEAMGELARVSSAGASGAVYVYEDFAERSTLLRWALLAANVWRGITTRTPHRALYGLCVIASPVIYLLFTLPAKILGLIPGLRNLSSAIPFHFGRGPFSLAGDLYDRFATPVEYRYSRDTAVRLVESGGFMVSRVQQHHGWMLAFQRRN